ncbi:hypothetical protein V8Z74_19640 [Comamonas sp. w2-DMI]|uniref:hypothetical protein n=1 Tax=Comamonas sp. w2-DMI TaxID=3126391 RepID=UPI0032E382F5
MSRTVTIGTLLGLNNRLAPTRMEVTLPNRATAAWLRVATNVDMTADGFLCSRGGFARSAAGGYHSLWADAQDAYAVRDGDLVHIHVRTLAQTVAVPGVGRARVSFVRLPDGMVYWSNGERLGRLQGALAREVTTAAPNPVPVVDPTAGSLPPGRYQLCFTALGPDGESASSEPQDVVLPQGGGIAIHGLKPGMLVYATGPDGEVFNEIAPGDYLSLGNTGAACSTFMLSAMPPGRALAHYLGSLLVARGRFLYLSEPYRYGLTHASRAFIPFPGEITVLQAFDDGLYVCADKTYWIAGDPLNTSPVVVLPYGALPGSLATDPREKTAYWQGEQGVVVARSGGAVSVPQDDALLFAAAVGGATLVREQGGEKHVIAARFDIDPL